MWIYAKDCASEKDKKTTRIKWESKKVNRRKIIKNNEMKRSKNVEVGEIKLQLDE